jgi:hypothetical protein
MSRLLLHCGNIELKKKSPSKDGDQLFNSLLFV